MSRHRTSQGSVSAQPTPDNRRTALPIPDSELDGLVYLLRDNLRRADAMVTTAEGLIEQPCDESNEEDEDGGILRHRMRIEYLVEAGKHAVRAALYTTDQIDAVLSARKRRA